MSTARVANGYVKKGLPENSGRPFSLQIKRNLSRLFESNFSHQVLAGDRANIGVCQNYLVG
jgi:hypothetical protein